MTENKTIDMFDTVRVREASATHEAGLAGLTGTVNGWTTPSHNYVNNIEVIGELTEDFAINVHLEDLKEDFWFTSDLLEFIDHSPGLEIRVGKKRLVRTEDGEWEKLPINTEGEVPEETTNEETAHNIENKSFWGKITKTIFNK